MTSKYEFQTIGGKRKDKIWGLAGTNISSTPDGTDYDGFIEVYKGDKMIGYQSDYQDFCIDGSFQDTTDWSENGIVEGTGDNRLYLDQDDVLTLFRILRDIECDDKTLWEKYTDNSAYPHVGGSK